MEAAASPLPSEDTTPPVTKTYLAAISSSRDYFVFECFLRVLIPGSGWAWKPGRRTSWGARSIIPEVGCGKLGRNHNCAVGSSAAMQGQFLEIIVEIRLLEG